MNGQLYGLDREGKCGRLMLVPTIIEIKNRINEYKIDVQNIKNPNYIPNDIIKAYLTLRDDLRIR